jgi:protein tyrosine phosphatase (PTP) superfamily phosphohydrolase (DUF442 family)
MTKANCGGCCGRRRWVYILRRLRLPGSTLCATCRRAPQRGLYGGAGSPDLSTRGGHPPVSLRRRTIGAILRFVDLARTPHVGRLAISSTLLPTSWVGDRWRDWVIRLVGLTVAVLLFGNVAILAASGVARLVVTQSGPPQAVPGIENFQAVDDHVWRGGLPSDDGYRALAAAGVTTVVDLRSDYDAGDDALLRNLGITLVRVPMRDGQAPIAAEVDKALAAIDGSEGRVFVHCSAGVGRTGSVVALHLLRNHEDSRAGALTRNLAVGPPSLEQIAFVLSARNGTPNQPNEAVVALSRFLDAPRQLWNRLT